MSRPEPDASRCAHLLTYLPDYQDFERWWAEYIVGSWGQPGTSGSDEYGKPHGFMHGLPKNRTVTHQLVSPKLVALWKRQSRKELGLVEALALELAWPIELHHDYGAPAKAWVRLESASSLAPPRDSTTPAGRPLESPLEPTACGIHATVSIFNKTATRLPEALYVSHKPVGSGAISSRWSMAVLGSSVDPLDVAAGAARGMHAVDAAGVSLTTTQEADDPHASSTLTLGTLDAAVVRWEEPLPFPTPLHRQPEVSLGMSYVLHDNIWNTNYPFWYPFSAEPTAGNLAFRFTMTAA